MVKVLNNFVPGKVSLPGLQMAIFSLFPHRAEGTRELCANSFIEKEHCSHPQGPRPPDLGISQRPHRLTSSHWALGFIHINLGGKQIFKPQQPEWVENKPSLWDQEWPRTLGQQEANREE